MSRLLLANGKQIEIPLDKGINMEDYTADDEADHKLEIDVEDGIRYDKLKKEKQ